jgi:hypothetical protein
VNSVSTFTAASNPVPSKKLPIKSPLPDTLFTLLPRISPKSNALTAPTTPNNTYIDLPPLCSVELVNSTISSNGNRRVSLDPVVFAWNLAPQHLPAKLLSSSAHLDSQLQQLRSNLTNFRLSPNATKSDTQFANLIHAHMTTPSYSSAIIWSIVLTLLISSLITFCIFFMYLRRSRLCRSRHPSDVPMLDLAVSVAQPLPPAYQAPPFHYEDEISYIARTGNLSGSASATRPIIQGTSSQK